MTASATICPYEEVTMAIKLGLLALPLPFPFVLRHREIPAQ